MKVCTIALTLMFCTGMAEGAKKVKTPKSHAARGYKAHKPAHANKIRKASKHHARNRVN